MIHCVHTIDTDVIFKERFQCCQCLNMAAYEQNLLALDCQEKRKRIHNAAAWHKGYEKRKAKGL